MKYLIIGFSLAVACSCGTLHAQVFNSGTIVSLNGVWDFKADHYNQGEQLGWFKPASSSASWDKMEVPGNWDIRNEYAGYIGKGWYRTYFTAPAGSQGKSIVIRFEAVGIAYKVWLNGALIFQTDAGFFPSDIDVSSKLKTGEKNCLIVQADNSFKSGAYWSWGGIRRPVTMVIRDPIHIARYKIKAIPDLKSGTADITLDLDINNGKKLKEKVGIYWELVFGGKLIKKGSSELALSGTVKQGYSVSIPLDKDAVNLWHFDRPQLYTMKIQIQQHGKPIHAIQQRIGIRKAEIVNGQFLLNGESVRGVGLNWVADDRLSGNILSEESFKRDIDNLKSLGCNLTRLSHMPLPNDVYDYLDEKGMLVISEIPVWGTTPLADPANPASKIWMRKMVDYAFNHPSIIGWCVGNEIGNLKLNPHVLAYGREMIQYTKDSLDDSRLVVLVSHTAGRQQEDPSQYGDFVPFNTYSITGRNIDMVHANQPGKLIMITEFGENLIGDDINTTLGNFEASMNEFRGRHYLFGASLWTYNDYRSNYRNSNLSWDTKVSQNRDWGVLDGYGNKKRAFYRLRKIFAPLKAMEVSTSLKGLQVDLQARDALDLPAYTLQGFKLVVEDFDNDQKLINKMEMTLPPIPPNNVRHHFALDEVPLKTIAASRTVSLVSPAQYAVMDTTLYFVPPATPEIRAVFNNGSKLRVVFSPVKNGTEYILVFGDGDQKKQTAATIDQHIEVELPEAWQVTGKVLDLQLIALNSAGQSSSKLLKEKIRGSGNLPPVVKGLRSTQGGISIGYSSDKEEYLFKLQFSNTPDFSGVSNTFQTTNKGACHIPFLKKGERYYVRICSVEQFDIQSEWSEVWSEVVR